MKSLFHLSVLALVLMTPLSSANASSVNVFAAASMKTALDQAAKTYKNQSGKDIVTTYGSSAALAKQIAETAPADIFISADEAWMDDLAKKNLIKPDTRKDLAGNTLVMVAAVGSDIKVDLKNPKDLATILGDEKIAVGDVKSVPAGKYAKAALEKLGLWTTVEPHLAMQENVRAALALVARGEAKLGIVYGSDVRAEPKVHVVADFPDSSHSPILYPAAVIAASTNMDAPDFLDFLHSKEGQLIFKENGFTLLE